MSVYAQDYGYFFNSNNSDRKYNADSFEEWLKPFFVSGVFAGGLQVTAQDTPDMSVKVSAGYANLDGKAARWTESNTLALDTASGVYSRIDTIVLRRDNTNRAVSIEVVKGTASASPQPTAPTRNSDIYELVLAQILVGVGVTEIVASKITDKRMDSSVCGYVAATVTEIDFDQIKAQFDGWIADFEADTDEWFDAQADYFDDWFETIRGQLDEDAAGHLQNEVDDTQAMIADPYDQHTVYQEGDTCTHGGALYRRNSWGSDTPAAETWTAEHWTEIAVMDELDTATDEIKNLQSDIATYLATTGSLASVEEELATLGASMADHQFKNIKIRTSAASGVFEAATSYYGTLKRNTTGIYVVELQGVGAVWQTIYGLYSSGSWKWICPYKVITSDTISFNGKSAGESGYESFTLSENLYGKKIISSVVNCSHPGAANGLQITPSFPSSGTTCYAMYYCPKAITQTCNVTITAYYI